MSRTPVFYPLIAFLFIALIAGGIGLFFLSIDDKDSGIGPYQDFAVKDVSKPQEFILPPQLLPPVVIRYRIEGIVDDSASVSFQTDTYCYSHVKFKGAVADSAVSDFYESREMHINYEPKRVKKGYLVIKAALNW